jgi:hypothetical protein
VTVERVKFADGRPLDAAEVKLLEAVNAGQTADYRPFIASGKAPPQVEHWDDSRTISAGAILGIIRGTTPGLRLTRAGLRIAGARIAGALQLASLHFPYPLELIGCRVDNPIVLDGAKIDSLNLTGSRIGRMNASSLEVSSGVFLNNGFVAEDTVCLHHSRIGGDLSCAGGKLNHSERLALDAEGVEIGGHVLLSNGLTANGQVNFTDAKVGGLFYCAHGLIENPGRKALTMDRARFASDVIFSNAFKVRGEMSCAGATITRLLYFNNCSLDNSEGRALAARMECALALTRCWGTGFMREGRCSSATR